MKKSNIGIIQNFSLKSSHPHHYRVHHQRARAGQVAGDVLIAAGYFLDPVVSFASEQSHAPKGVIGFFVLTTLSSWPEFKCCPSLLNRKKYLAAILNITVSNITNIWLAITGVATYFFMMAF